MLFVGALSAINVSKSATVILLVRAAILTQTHLHFPSLGRMYTIRVRICTSNGALVLPEADGAMSTTNPQARRFNIPMRLLISIRSSPPNELEECTNVTCGRRSMFSGSLAFRSKVSIACHQGGDVEEISEYFDSLYTHANWIRN